MKMILLGSGTSHGVPVIGCDCPVCHSSDPRDKRNRCSAYVEAAGNEAKGEDGKNFSTTNILIDAGPEFRLQALRFGIRRLDGVLVTHSHADHIHGLDDLRIFSHKNPLNSRTKTTAGTGLPIYSNKNTIRDIKFRFDYAFKEVTKGGGVPKFNLVEAEKYGAKNPVKIGSVECIPIPMMHGSIETCGWMLSCPGADGKKHSIAYLTDLNYISKNSLALVTENCGCLDHLVIDGLRVEKHSTHFSFDEALACADRIGAAHSWLTHMTHLMSHADLEKYISGKIEDYPNLARICGEGGSVGPAYDGLVLETC